MSDDAVDAKRITLAILAGGQGGRMGMPKAMLRLQDRPILEYLLERIAWPGPRILVTAPDRQGPPGSGVFDREVVDPAAGIGPLRGILTALQSTQTGLLIVATVDMPGIQREHLIWLAAQLGRGRKLGVMCRRADGQVEPFPLALRREAASTIAQRLEDGRRSVHGLLGDERFAAIDAPGDWPDDMWFNLNEPADVRRFESRR